MKTVKMLTCQKWDQLVKNTYGREYCFQQQDDCKDRDVFHLTVPGEPVDFSKTEIPEVVNGPKMGVSFAHG